MALREIFPEIMCPLGRSRQLDKSESVHDHDVSAMDLLLRKSSKSEDKARLAGM